jgi:hypothetical protein
MIAIIALASLIVTLMIVGFIVNLYLYSNKALPLTQFDRELDEAAEPQPHLHDSIFAQ